MFYKIKYSGGRFPRTVTLKGGTKISFRPDRKMLIVEEYYALLLLKSNSRLRPGKWEFAIIGIEEEISTPPPQLMEEPEEEPEPKEEPKISEKRPVGRPKTVKRMAT